jgi:hypothetical protein
VLTAVLLVVIQDWRVSITALAVQYMLVGMLFAG